MPRKKSILLAIRALFVPSFYKSLTFDGTFPLQIDKHVKILIHSYQEYGLETEWFWHGITGWEAASIQIWVNLCASAGHTATSAILDIGACEGIYALVTKALIPGSRVIAVEPLHGNFEKLKRNIAINHFAIETLQVACADCDGEALLFRDSNPTSTEASLTQGERARDRPCSERVLTRTIDGLVDEMQIERIDLVKIDVEGAEVAVLRGMEQSLQQFRPVILVEILFEAVADALERMLAPLSYSYFDINDDPRNGRPRVVASSKLSKGMCLNWLLVPSERVDALAPAWSSLLVTK